MLDKQLFEGYLKDIWLVQYWPMLDTTNEDKQKDKNVKYTLDCVAPPTPDIQKYGMFMGKTLMIINRFD